MAKYVNRYIYMGIYMCVCIYVNITFMGHSGVGDREDVWFSSSAFNLWSRRGNKLRQL